MKKIIIVLLLFFSIRNLVFATPETKTTGSSEPNTNTAQSAQQTPVFLKNFDEILSKWADEFVRYIITPKEYEFYKTLTSQTERTDFIEKFWEVRDPTPETPENEYRQEYMQRFIYATKKFASGKAGWATDRGRVYIVFGPPASVMSDPTGWGAGNLASEIWTYNGLKGVRVKASFDVVFIDFSGAGNFEMVSNLSDNVTFFSKNGYSLSGLENYAKLRVDGSFLSEDYLNYNRSVRNETKLQMDQSEFIDMLQLLHEPSNTITVKDNPSIATNYSYSKLSYNQQIGFYATENENTALLLLLEIDPQQLTTQQQSDSTEKYRFAFQCFITITDPQTKEHIKTIEETHSFTIPIQEYNSKQTGTYIYDSLFILEPKQYDVLTIILDKESHAFGTFSQSILVPRFTRGSVQMSTPLIIKNIWKTSPDSTVAQPLRFNDNTLVPAVDGLIGTADDTSIYLIAYGVNSPEYKELKLVLTLSADTQTHTLLNAKIKLSGSDRISILSKFPHEAIHEGIYPCTISLRTDNDAELATSTIQIKKKKSAAPDKTE